MDRLEHIDISIHISTVVKHIEAIFGLKDRFAIRNDFESRFIVYPLVLFP
ncbi:MAG: hypothetical protein RBR15_11920 [Sphaerochaeta sp.]|nr:hypothetical protein [Sphaerochaeta sp.]